MEVVVLAVVEGIRDVEAEPGPIAASFLIRITGTDSRSSLQTTRSTTPSLSPKATGHGKLSFRTSNQVLARFGAISWMDSPTLGRMDLDVGDHRGDP